jgi:hypothetical protein
MQRPKERMAIFQLCLNEENKQYSITKAPKGRETRTRATYAVRSSCYYVIPKALVNSNTLLKHHAEERLIDAKIVEKVSLRFKQEQEQKQQEQKQERATTISSAVHNNLVNHGRHLATPAVPTTPAELKFCANIQDVLRKNEYC